MEKVDCQNCRVAIVVEGQVWDGIVLCQECEATYRELAETY